MLETEFVPEDLPDEFLQYEHGVKQLVGGIGKTGALSMILERDAEKTVVRELFNKVPLRVQKVLYVEESLPQMAYVYIMSPSGGILQGDRLRIDIAVKDHAQAHITTQAATKVYKMNRNYATQIINVCANAHSYLELIPDQLIPYRNARFYQCVKMQVHDTATAVYSEIITPGRVARGECFAYDACCFKTVATDHNSKIRFVDTFMLVPRKQKFFGFGFNAKSILANMYILTGKIDAGSLSDVAHNIIAQNSVKGGTSVLPRKDGISARIIASSVEEAKNAIDMILNKIRRDILGGSFAGTRKY
jgi:urease accessory protein